ncbi:hypothetical protein J7T55_001676 [Diaporthe amygdali]|uniref:uncharacterized protein n=1 Tax=Phomopsis amygdali TaxID=1214568 RepID=UPI0022FE3A52|nr:uncharacterized protein J7T55_001676 [Diaporthe amygdali]KAJ0104189.1 hypothetical protein J7T55_001676 [Diaporthe amygdali]
MTTFSAAVHAAQCQAIQHRALSATLKIAENVSQWNGSDSPFTEVSMKLKELSEAAFELGNKLGEAGQISERLHNTLTDRLEKCAYAETIVEKETGAFAAQQFPVDEVLLSKYEHWAGLETSVMKALVEAIQINTADGQDKLLCGRGYRGLLEMADAAFRAVISSDTDPFGLNDEEPPAYDENPHEHVSDVKGPEPPASSTASPSPSKNTRESKLSEVFRAVTAPFRYKPEPLVMALCEASSRGDIDTVTSLISSGANINGRNDEGKTPLVQAIENQQPNVVTKLLQLGASKDVSDSAKKLPPLFWAASAGDIPMAKLLLQYGCSPNHKNIYGWAYFLDIVDKGDLGMVKLLLDHGAEVNATDQYGRVAFQHAYSRNNLAMLKLLQSRGGSVNATDITGCPIVILALQENKDDIFHFLLEHGANVNSTSSTGTPLVIEAFTRQRTNIVKKLLERGADPNAKDLVGTSMLMNTIKAQTFTANGREELIKLLLTYGATPNDSDMWGKSAVSLLIERQHTSLLPLLLEKGLDPNKELGNGETLLIHAIDCGNAELIKKLLRHGASPNGSNKKGCTPLVQAVQARDFETVKLLVASGADVNAMGVISPLDLARLLKVKETEDLLVKSGAR